ncbi:UNVERIFIED_CONTAM: hypothetical protein NCL1_18247 [Trichonephila clavipes]
MFELGKTRPLPGHSSIGSISTRKKLHPGVPPLTTETNKGGSVPVIWQKPGTALTWSTPRILCYSIRYVHFELVVCGLDGKRRKGEIGRQDEG